jgi:hypothetical protein
MGVLDDTATLVAIRSVRSRVEWDDGRVDTVLAYTGARS